MQQNLHTELIDEIVDLLSADSEFLVEGKISKDRISNAALSMDPGLLSILSKSERARRLFCTEVDGTLIFDKIRFQKFILSKEFMPNNFTQFRIKWGLYNKRQDQYLADIDDIVLAWPYKDCVLEGGQDSDTTKRNEVFWSELLAPDQINRLFEPKALTNFKVVGADDIELAPSLLSKENNLVLKGNNLIALHSLKKRYAGEVDVIYIDPPYFFNKRKASDTFSYNSNFKFSSWLTFMKNRLEIAKVLLKDEKGIIFISTNEEGLNHLKVTCDEIFTVDKYISTFIWKKRAGGGNDSETVSLNHEYVLCYGSHNGLCKLPFDEKQLKKYKHKDTKFETHGPYTTKNLHDSSLRDSKGLHFDIECPDGTILRGDDFQWKCNKTTFEERELDDRIVFKEKKDGGWSVHYKIYLYENKGKLIWVDHNGIQNTEARGILKKKGIVPNAFLDTKKVGFNSAGTKELGELFPEVKSAFSYPKPVSLIKHLLTEMIETKDALVLDFFAGSGTTAHAVLAQNKEDGGNRKFILVEQMDYITSVTTERVKRAIEKYDFEDFFIYAEMEELNQQYVTKLKHSASRSSTLKVWEKMEQNAFLSYKIGDEIKADLTNLLDDEIKQSLLLILENNMLYLPLSEIEDITYEMSSEDISMNKMFYGDEV